MHHLRGTVFLERFQDKVEMSGHEAVGNNLHSAGGIRKTLVEIVFKLFASFLTTHQEVREFWQWISNSKVFQSLQHALIVFFRIENLEARDAFIHYMVDVANLQWLFSLHNGLIVPGSTRGVESRF